MASKMNIAARWVADDGRTWPYNGSAQAMVSDIPEEAKCAVKSGAVVTDTVLGMLVAYDEGEFILTVAGIPTP